MDNTSTIKGATPELGYITVPQVEKLTFANEPQNGKFKRKFKENPFIIIGM